MSLSQTIKGLGGGLAALGVRVDKASEAKPISAATQDLFVVTNGKILLTSLIGQVTVVITDGGADNITLTHYHTTGVPGAVNLGAALDIGGDIVDTIYIITGTYAGGVVVVQDDGGVGVWIASMGTQLLILQPGTIRMACSGTETGSTKWVMHYVALDPGSVVSPS